MTGKFISCDWGTSSFRLRLVDTKTLAILAEQQSDEGIAVTFDAWKKTGDPNPENRINFYLAVIEKNCRALEEKINKSLDGISVLISGMASSTIGLIELPYYPVPFPVNGCELNTHVLKATPDFKHDTFIISGVKSEDDVMRGEETQLIGLINDSVINTTIENLFIFPGTHSKHMLIKNGNLIGFKTYMTGEFFNLLSNNSILKDSVQITDDQDHHANFKRGVLASLQNNLLHSAFSVRTNVLFDKLTKADNYFYLSGLLIGTELQELKKSSAIPIHLCGGSNLSLHYAAALEILGLTKQTTIIDPQQMDKAVIAGQLKIYNSLNHE